MKALALILAACLPFAALAEDKATGKPAEEKADAKAEQKHGRHKATKSTDSYKNYRESQRNSKQEAKDAK